MDYADFYKPSVEFKRSLQIQSNVPINNYIKF